MRRIKTDNLLHGRSAILRFLLDRGYGRIAAEHILKSGALATFKVGERVSARQSALEQSLRQFESGAVLQAAE
jgi:hypothetical protein